MNDTPVGNGPRMRTMTFDEADAYMIAKAMMIGANTALMSGAHDARARLQHYRDQFLAIAPPAAALMRHNTDVAEMVIALDTVTSWRALRIRPHWRGWGKGAPATILIGDRTWSTRDDVDDEAFAAIVAMIAGFAPMDRFRNVQDGDNAIVNEERPERR